MKHVYDESADFIESYPVHFDINEPSNLSKMLTVISIEGMVSRTQVKRLLDARHMELNQASCYRKFDAISPQIHTLLF